MSRVFLNKLSELNSWMNNSLRLMYSRVILIFHNCLLRTVFCTFVWVVVQILQLFRVLFPTIRQEVLYICCIWGQPLFHLCLGKMAKMGDEGMLLDFCCTVLYLNCQWLRKAKNPITTSSAATRYSFLRFIEEIFIRSDVVLLASAMSWPNRTRSQEPRNKIVQKSRFLLTLFH